MDSNPGRRSYDGTYETPYGFLPAIQARALLSEAQNHRCCYCAVVMTDPEIRPPIPTACTIEHIMSRSRGGSNHWDNLVAACSQCNSWRSSDKDENGYEIAAIAWFYKRTSGDDVRPKSHRKVKGPATTPHKPKITNVSRYPLPSMQARAEAAEIARRAATAHRDAIRAIQAERGATDRAVRASIPVKKPNGNPNDCDFDPAWRGHPLIKPPPKREEPPPLSSMSKGHRQRMKSAAIAQAPFIGR